MMSDIIPMKKRKANDGRPVTLDDGAAHDVNTNKTNNDGYGFLSSWVGYFSGRRDGAPAYPPATNIFHEWRGEWKK